MLLETISFVTDRLEVNCWKHFFFFNFRTKTISLIRDVCCFVVKLTLKMHLHFQPLHDWAIENVVIVGYGTLKLIKKKQKKTKLDNCSHSFPYSHCSLWLTCTQKKRKIDDSTGFLQRGPLRGFKIPYYRYRILCYIMISFQRGCFCRKCMCLWSKNTCFTFTWFLRVQRPGLPSAKSSE